MAVQIKTGGTPVYSLTSPPEHPTPEPPSSLIAKKMQYGDRTILVTIPFPDSIELITDVFNEHLHDPYATGGSLKWIYTQIDQELSEWVGGFKTGQTFFEPAPQVKKYSAIFLIPYNEAEPLNRATLTLSRRQGETFPIWSVKLEFSASKAGPNGLVKLISAVNAGIKWGQPPV